MAHVETLRIAEPVAKLTSTALREQYFQEEDVPCP